MTAKSPDGGKIDSDRLFHALGDPTRRAILDRLCAAPASVSSLAQPLGITLTAVAQHLAILEECGLARSEKVGRVRTCQINPAGFDALEHWIRQHRTTWETRLDQLDEFLRDEDDA
jgi:DNA-binding transcriptional ArsR family regulator